MKTIPVTVRKKSICQSKVRSQLLFDKFPGLLCVFPLLPLAHSHLGWMSWFPKLGQEKESRGCSFWWGDIKIWVSSVRNSNHYFCLFLAPGHFLSICSRHDVIVTSITSMKMRGGVEASIGIQTAGPSGAGCCLWYFFQCRGLRMQEASQRTIYDPNPFCSLFALEPVTALSYLTLGAVFLCKGPSFSRKHTLRNQYKIWSNQVKLFCWPNLNALCKVFLFIKLL